MESTSTTERLAVRREIEIAASPETVWRYLVDPEHALAWWGVSIEMDVRPGGAYRVEVLPGHVARGEFVVVDPPRRLVYTFGWEPGSGGPDPVAPGSTTVEIDLVPAAGSTRLLFVHRDLPTPESASSHGHGWDHYLSRLAVAAADGDPGPDPWLEEER